jgi:hypothetical protein
MGMNTEKQNGTTIADLCYKDGDDYRNVGSLIYFRTDEADVRLDIIPIGLWKQGEEWLIGNFMPSEKIPDAPYIDGDITAPSDKRGERIKVGHIHTRDNEIGDAQYYMTLFGIPVGSWRKLIAESDAGKGKRSLFLKVEME